MNISLKFLLELGVLRVSEIPIQQGEEENKMDAYLNEYIVNMMDNQEYREGIVFFPMWSKIKSLFVR